MLVWRDANGRWFGGERCLQPIQPGRVGCGVQPVRQISAAFECRARKQACRTDGQTADVGPDNPQEFCCQVIGSKLSMLVESSRLPVDQDPARYPRFPLPSPERLDLSAFLRGKGPRVRQNQSGIAELLQFSGLDL